MKWVCTWVKCCGWRSIYVWIRVKMADEWSSMMWECENIRILEYCYKDKIVFIYMNYFCPYQTHRPSPWSYISFAHKNSINIHEPRSATRYMHFAIYVPCVDLLHLLRRKSLFLDPVNELGYSLECRSFDSAAFLSVILGCERLDCGAPHCEKGPLSIGQCTPWSDHDNIKLDAIMVMISINIYISNVNAMQLV
jgi:hypothetical protein